LDSLKALDPNRPIREADIATSFKALADANARADIITEVPVKIDRDWFPRSTIK
jgi:hypothetical protein